MTPNRLPAHTGWAINRGRWLDEPDPERDDTETLGLPVPEWVELIPIPRHPQEARR